MIFFAVVLLFLNQTVFAAVPGCLESGHKYGLGRPGAAQQEVPEGLEEFYSQKVSWYPCETEGGMSAASTVTGYECAKIMVPLDYTDPEGVTIQVAMKKYLATGSQFQGSLFLNPGGPGESGVLAVEEVGAVSAFAELGGAYDVVGFDPRGVGSSTPVLCGDQKQQDSPGPDSTDVSPPPRDEGAQEERDEAERQIVASMGAITAARERCETSTQPVELLDHVDTQSAARDMDIMRALVGADELNYIGLSYGTYLGTLYADLFPEKVGRFVLDGAIDPSLSLAERDRQQDAGFERALRPLVEQCLATSGCPLSGDTDTAVQQMRDFAASLDADPLPTGDPDAPMTETSFWVATEVALYSQLVWSEYYTALARAMTQRDGQALAHAIDGTVLDVSRLAVTCMDYPLQGDMEDWIRESITTRQESPIFGREGSVNAECSAWGHNGDKDPEEIHAEGANPILVVGTTGDPATPYEWAQSLAAQLDSGQLLTWEGNGHLAYRHADPCVTSAVNTYLLTGDMPDDGLICSGE